MNNFDSDLSGMRASFQILDITTQFVLPMTYFIVMFLRYIIICNPIMLSTYPSLPKTICFIITIVFFCLGISISSFWDKHGFGNELENAHGEENTAHVTYTSSVKLVVMSFEVVLVSVGTFFLVKKTNSVLDRSIHFIQNLNREYHNKRLLVYTKLKQFNIAIFFLNMISMGLRFTSFLTEELLRVFPADAMPTTLFYMYFRAAIDIFCSMEICIFPLFVLCFQSKVRSLFKILQRKILCHREGALER